MNKILFFNYNNSGGKALFFSQLILLIAFLHIIIIIPDCYSFYSKYGIIDYNLNETYLYSNVFTLNSVTSKLETYGIKYNYAFFIIIGIYIMSIILALLEIYRFLFSIIIMIIHCLIINSGYLFNYGADSMISFALFLNIFFSCERFFSKGTYDLIFSSAIRLVQLQLCVIYFFSGFGKILGFDWFDGNAIYLTLGLYMSETSFEYMASVMPPFIFKIIGWHIVLIELFYPIFILFRKSRKIIIVDIIIMHILISVLIGLHFFAIAMILFNLIAFYPDKLISLKVKTILFFNGFKTTT